MKVRMKVRPTGYVSFAGGPMRSWPEVGAVLDVPDAVADDLITAGRAEKVLSAEVDPTAVGAEPPVETRPAPTDDEERRVRRPTAAAARKPTPGA